MKYPITTLTAALCGTALLLATPALAQETTSSGSPLTVRTNDMNLARQFAGMFGGAELPDDLAGGTQASLSLDDGGTLAANTLSGDEWLVIDARPNLLMAVFGEQVQQGRMMAQFMLGSQLAQQGMKQPEIASMLDGVFGFPEQIARLVITLPEEPKSADDPMSASLRLEAVKDTWLDKLMTGLRPRPEGIRRLGGEDLAEFHMSVDLPAILPMVLPMAKMLSTIQIDDAEKRQTLSAAIDTMYVELDGSFSMVWSPDTGMRSLMGVRDGAKIATLMGQPAWRDLSAAAVEAQGMAEVEFSKLDKAYRESAIYRLSIAYDDPNMEAVFEGGVMEGLQAVAGDAMVSTTMGGNMQPALQGLIDDVLDQRLTRKSLGKDVLMSGKVQLAEAFEGLAGMLMSMGAPAPADAEDLPESLGLTVSKQGRALVIDLQTR